MSALGHKRTYGFTDQGAQPKSKTPDRPTLEYYRAQLHLWSRWRLPQRMQRRRLSWPALFVFAQWLDQDIP